MDTRGDNNSQQPTYSTGAPPQPAYYPLPPQPARKTKRTTPLWVTIAVGVGGLAIGTGIGGAGSSKQDTAATSTASTGAPGAPTKAPAAAAAPADKGPTGDIALGKFTIDTVGAVHVPITVINHSSKTSNYIIEFEVDNAAGEKIGDGLAASNNIAPGQTAKLDGMAMSDADGATLVKLTKVTRYAS